MMPLLVAAQVASRWSLKAKENVMLVPDIVAVLRAAVHEASAHQFQGLLSLALTGYHSSLLRIWTM